MILTEELLARKNNFITDLRLETMENVIKTYENIACDVETMSRQELNKLIRKLRDDFRSILPVLSKSAITAMEAVDSAVTLCEKCDAVCNLMLNNDKELLDNETKVLLGGDLKNLLNKLQQMSTNRFSHGTGTVTELFEAQTYSPADRMASVSGPSINAPSNMKRASARNQLPIKLKDPPILNNQNFAVTVSPPVGAVLPLLVAGSITTPTAVSGDSLGQSERDLRETKTSSSRRSGIGGGTDDYTFKTQARCDADDDDRKPPARDDRKPAANDSKSLITNNSHHLDFQPYDLWAECSEEENIDTHQKHIDDCEDPDDQLDSSVDSGTVNITDRVLSLKIKFDVKPYRLMCSAKKCCSGPVGEETFKGKKCKKCQRWCHFCCGVTQNNETSLLCFNCYRKSAIKVRGFNPRENLPFKRVRKINEELALQHTPPPGLLAFDSWRGEADQNVADYNVALYKKLGNPHIQSMIDQSMIPKIVYTTREEFGLPTSDINISDNNWLTERQRYRGEDDANLHATPRRVKNAPRRRLENITRVEEGKVPDGTMSGMETEIPTIRRSSRKRKKSAVNRDPIPESSEVIDMSQEPTTVQQNNQAEQHIKKTQAEKQVVVIDQYHGDDVPFTVTIFQTETGTESIECAVMSPNRAVGEVGHIDTYYWTETADPVVVTVDPETIIHKFKVSKLKDMYLEGEQICGKISGYHLIMIISSLIYRTKQKNEFERIQRQGEVAGEDEERRRLAQARTIFDCFSNELLDSAIDYEQADEPIPSPEILATIPALYTHGEFIEFLRSDFLSNG